MGRSDKVARVYPDIFALTAYVFFYIPGNQNWSRVFLLHRCGIVAASAHPDLGVCSEDPELLTRTGFYSSAIVTRSINNSTCKLKDSCTAVVHDDTYSVELPFSFSE